MAFIPNLSLPGYYGIPPNHLYTVSPFKLNHNESGIIIYNNNMEFTGKMNVRDAAYAIFLHFIDNPCVDAIRYNLFTLEIKPKIDLVLAVKTSIHRKGYRRFKKLKEEFDKLKPLMVFL